MLKLIPVIDILNAQVVRGIAGQRESYQPNKSLLVDGSDPVATTLALVESFQVDTIYIADLDALTGVGLSNEIIQEISALGVKTVVDAGGTSAADVEQTFSLGVDSVVIPLESLQSLTTLDEIIDSSRAGSRLPSQLKNIVFSLDLISGEILSPLQGKFSPMQIVDEVYQRGIRRMIVLDLAGVGVSAGVPTIPLCQDIKATYPDLEIWTGGGVRSIADVQELDAAGIDGVLVASALHDGKITPTEWMNQ